MQSRDYSQSSDLLRDPASDAVEADAQGSGGHQPITRARFSTRELIIQALAQEVRRSLRDMSGYVKLLAYLLVLTYNIHWFAARHYINSQDNAADAATADKWVSQILSPLLRGVDLTATPPLLPRVLLGLAFTTTWFNFIFSLRVLHPAMAASICIAQRVLYLLLRFILLSFLLMTAFGGGIMILNAGLRSYRPIDGVGASMLMMFRSAVFADSRYDTSVLRSRIEEMPVVRGFLIALTVVFWVFWICLLISTLRCCMSAAELAGDPTRALTYYKFHSGELSTRRCHLPGSVGLTNAIPVSQGCCS